MNNKKSLMLFLSVGLILSAHIARAERLKTVTVELVRPVSVDVVIEWGDQVGFPVWYSPNSDQQVIPAGSKSLSITYDLDFLVTIPPRSEQPTSYTIQARAGGSGTVLPRCDTPYLPGMDATTNPETVHLDTADMYCDGVLVPEFFREEMLHRGDFDNDGQVGTPDFNLLLSNFGQPGSIEEGDLNGNGFIEGNDFLTIQSNLGFLRPL